MSDEGPTKEQIVNAVCNHYGASSIEDLYEKDSFKREFSKRSQSPPTTAEEFHKLADATILGMNSVTEENVNATVRLLEPSGVEVKDRQKNVIGKGARILLPNGYTRTLLFDLPGETGQAVEVAGCTVRRSLAEGKESMTLPREASNFKVLSKDVAAPMGDMPVNPLVYENVTTKDGRTIPAEPWRVNKFGVYKLEAGGYEPVIATWTVDSDPGRIKVKDFSSPFKIALTCRSGGLTATYSPTQDELADKFGIAVGSNASAYGTLAGRRFLGGVKVGFTHPTDAKGLGEGGQGAVDELMEILERGDTLGFLTNPTEKGRRNLAMRPYKDSKTGEMVGAKTFGSTVKEGNFDAFYPNLPICLVGGQWKAASEVQPEDTVDQRIYNVEVGETGDIKLSVYVGDKGATPWISPNGVEGGFIVWEGDANTLPSSSSFSGVTAGTGLPSWMQKTIEA